MGLDMYYYAEKLLDTSSLPINYQQYEPVTLQPVHNAACWDQEHAYVSGWAWKREPDPAYRQLIELTGITPSPDSPSFLVCPHGALACVAYWRKANQIHNWFVEHVQDGIDECQLSQVSIAQMGELVLTCRKALADRNPDLLPPTSGVFFGSTEIDEYYWSDLQATIDQLVPLAEFEGRMFYRSSW